MMNDGEFEVWSKRVRLSDSAVTAITRVRLSQPTRNVTNTAGNFCGTFASRKMRCNIQWESWTGERALVLLWEHDPTCLEMWDQPLSLKINYTLSSGRRSGARTKVDYLVIKHDSAGIVDFKTSEELRKLVFNEPYRWVQTSANTWDQPPAREACEKIGLGYQLLTDHDVPHILLRNIDFLRPKLLRKIHVPDDVAGKVRQILMDEPRILLTTAIVLAGNAELIFEGHFLRYWFLDLKSEALALPDNTWVYADARSASMYQAVDRTRALQFRPRPDPDKLEIGAIVHWGDTEYQIANITRTNIFLQALGRPLLPLSYTDFSSLVRSEQIVTNDHDQHTTKSGLEVLRRATPHAIDDAIVRLEVLEKVFEGKTIKQLGIPPRTFYDWKERFREGEMHYGSGFIGLIDRHDLKGNRTPRTDGAEIAVLQKSFAWLRNRVPRELSAGYAVYLSFCEDDSIPPRSYVSFINAWKSEDQYETTSDREGKRAAYPLKPPKHTSGKHTEQGPPEGDSPFSVVHFDHVQSNTFCRRTNGIDVIGKPWISLAIDAFTRLVLAYWLSMLAPSHASVMMLTRDIVRRHGWLPITVVTDSGKDFKADRTKKLLASKGCDHAFRPSGEPRFGIPVERMNLNIDHHLTKVVHGSNAVLRQPRNSSSSHDPRTLSYLTLEEFAERIEWLLFEHYPHRFHSGIQSIPFEKQRSAAMLQGDSWGVPVEFNDQFMFETLSTPHKHGGLVRQRDGIRLNGHNYYSNVLVGRDSMKLSDPPLYDPEDPTHIYARIDKKWERCQLVDSQLRRLPPEGHRRYYLSEHIHLLKPGTHKDKNRKSLTALGKFYRELDDSLEAQTKEYTANDAQVEGCIDNNLSSEICKTDLNALHDDPGKSNRIEQAQLKPAPISRRSHNT